MDPATIAVAVQLAAAALRVVQDYSAGTITQEEAHQRLVDAAAGLTDAIAMFNRAVATPPPAKE